MPIASLMDVVFLDYLPSARDATYVSGRFRVAMDFFVAGDEVRPVRRGRGYQYAISRITEEFSR